MIFDTPIKAHLVGGPLDGQRLIVSAAGLKANRWARDDLTLSRVSYQAVGTEDDEGYAYFAAADGSVDRLQLVRDWNSHP